MEKMAWDGPKWGREGFFPANPGLADILGRTDLDFENFYFSHLLDPKFPGFQISKIWPGRAWALGRVGPRVGRAWALGRVGPSGGPGGHASKELGCFRAGLKKVYTFWVRILKMCFTHISWSDSLKYFSPIFPNICKIFP